MKKVLSIILSLAMLLSMTAGIDFSAYAKSDLQNNETQKFFINAKNSDEAFECMNVYINAILQIDSVKKQLQGKNIVNPVTESTTLSDVVEGASPLLIDDIIVDVTKDDFLTEKYGDKYTNNKDAYDLAFTPLDNPNAKEDDWSFYKLYKFCESVKESDNKELKDYADDTLKKLDKLIDQCYKSMNTAEASDAVIKNLRSLTTNTITGGTKDAYDYSKYKVPTELKVPVANAALNAQNDNVFGNAMVKALVDNLIDIRNQNSPDNEKININVQDTLKDIWQRLYDEPAVTVFNLLPLITAVVDTVLPVILHDDIDDTSVISSIIKQLGGQADSVEDFVLTPAILGPLLESFTGKYIDIAKYSQAEDDTKYGIGAVHIDLNTALPAILHWITGDKETAYNLVGCYTDVHYHKAQFDEQGRYKLDDKNNVIRDEKESVAHFDNSVPRFTNIYIADKTIADLDIKGLVELAEKIDNDINFIDNDITADLFEHNQNGYDGVKEILMLLRDAVDEYLKEVNWSKETGTSEKNLIETAVTENGEQKNIYVDENDGINNISVAIPKIIKLFGTKIKGKYGVDFGFNSSSKVKTHSVGSLTETYNSSLNDFLILNGNLPSKENAEKSIMQTVDFIDEFEILKEIVFALEIHLKGDLKEVTVPENLSSIGLSTFSKTKVEKVNIPDSVDYIGIGAFKEAVNLTEINIPNELMYIGDMAFAGCENLKSIKLNNKLKYIDKFVFSDCIGLTNINIPENVSNIENNPFRNCSNLESITVDSNNKYYDSRDNCNAIITKQDILDDEDCIKANTLVSACIKTVIPNSVTSIDDYAFYGCTGLTNITIPNSVSSVGKEAFEGCTG